MRKIHGLTDAGVAKLEQQLQQSGNQTLIPFAHAARDLIEVVTPQINNPKPELSVEPWYFAIGVAGTTYPASADDHETSDYDEVCEAYSEADFYIDHAPSPDQSLAEIQAQLRQSCQLGREALPLELANAIDTLKYRDKLLQGLGALERIPASTGLEFANETITQRVMMIANWELEEGELSRGMYEALKKHAAERVNLRLKSAGAV